MRIFPAAERQCAPLHLSSQLRVARYISQQLKKQARASKYTGKMQPWRNLPCCSADVEINLQIVVLKSIACNNSKGVTRYFLHKSVLCASALFLKDSEEMLIFPVCFPILQRCIGFYFNISHLELELNSARLKTHSGYKMHQDGNNSCNFRQEMKVYRTQSSDSGWSGCWVWGSAYQLADWRSDFLQNNLL